MFSPLQDDEHTTYYMFSRAIHKVCVIMIIQSRFIILASEKTEFIGPEQLVNNVENRLYVICVRRMSRRSIHSIRQSNNDLIDHVIG